MNNIQKRLCRALLKLSFEHGFNTFALQKVADTAGVAVDGLYDEDKQAGHLWPFHPGASGEYAGLLTFSGHGENVGVGVYQGTHEMLGHWCGFNGLF